MSGRTLSDSRASNLVGVKKIAKVFLLAFELQIAFFEEFFAPELSDLVFLELIKSSAARKDDVVLSCLIHELFVNIFFPWRRFVD